MKLIARGEIAYGKGKIAEPGTMFEVAEDTALGLIAGGYAEQYVAPKTAEQIKREKAAEEAEKPAETSQDAGSL